MRSVHLDAEFLDGRTVVDRTVDVPGTGTAWVGEGEEPTSPEYKRETMPIRRMYFDAGPRRRHIRYAGPFVNGLVVVDVATAESDREMLRQRLDGQPHQKHPNWRLCTLTEPACTAWVRADGVIVRIRRDTDPDDGLYDEALSGEDVRQPVDERAG